MLKSVLFAGAAVALAASPAHAGGLLGSVTGSVNGALGGTVQGTLGGLGSNAADCLPGTGGANGVSEVRVAFFNHHTTLHALDELRDFPHR